MHQVMKSQIDFCVDLLLATLNDVATHLTTYQMTEHWADGRVIVRRASAEGIQFVTVTLPSLGKALDKALASDDPFKVPVGFKAMQDSQLPVFMGSLFELVFDKFGIQRSDASEQAVSCLRQVCYLFYKLELPPSQTQIDETLQRFKQNEAELRQHVGPALIEAAEQVRGSNGYEPFGVSSSLLAHIDMPILALARRLVCAVLGPIDPMDERFRPKHGPGSVATGEKEAEKMVFKRYYKALAAMFPYENYFFYNLTHLCDELHRYLSLEELDTPTAKVVLVPKDSRGPRLISSEPLEVQWIQQMLMANMVSAIESHPLTRGLVNFTDQSINRRLALRGSLGESNHLVTLDMKDASDRVHSDLVRILFPDPWVSALMAARSTHTRLPNGEVVHLAKFAPMGSATCFPVEALVFWALSTATIIDKSSRMTVNGSTINTSPFSTLSQLIWGVGRAGIPACERAVYVYGDDIILHREDYPAVERTLSSVGLLLNKDKCCVGTTFRESCGCDAYKGIDVTPLRMKATWSHRLTPNQILSHVAFHNAMIEKGWFATASSIRELILEKIGLPLYRIDRDPLTGNSQSERGHVHLLMPDDSPLKQDLSYVPHRYNKRIGRDQACLYKASSPQFKGESNWGEVLRKASTRRGVSAAVTEAYATRNALRRPPTPVGKDTGLLKWADRISPIAKACWYTSTRQVSLRRVWFTV